MKLKHSDPAAVRNGAMPAPGRWITSEPGDRSRWLQTSEYTPVNVSRILEAANGGDIAELAVAAREIQERNWEVILAMQVRKSALTGLDWGVEPGDGRPASKDAAEAFETALKESEIRVVEGGKCTKIAVNVGDQVEEGQVIVATEADKDTREYKAPVSGVITSIGCEVGKFVRLGQVLAVIASDSDAEETAPEPAAAAPVKES